MNLIPIPFIKAYWKYCGISLLAVIFHFVFTWTTSHYRGWYEPADYTRSMLIMMILCTIPASAEGFPYEG